MQVRADSDFLATGIWGFLCGQRDARFFEAFRIYYAAGAQTYCISTAGVVESQIDPGSLPSFREVQVEQVSAGFRALVPVFWADERPPLLLEILFAETPGADYLGELSSWIAFQMNQEAMIYDQYPSFLPFFHPPGPGAKLLNSALLEKRSMYFLNGQPGTGKRLFSALFRSLHQAGTGLDVVYYPEVALLDSDVQDTIVKGIERSSRVMFVASAYDIDLLMQRSIVLPELGKKLEGVRVLFKSVVPGSDEFVAVEDLYAAFKVKRPKPVESRNFDQLFLGSSNKSRALAPGQKLRDVIAKIEVEAIEEAMREVGMSQHRIARRLGISRGSLQHKLKKYQIPYSEWDEDAG